MKTSQFEQDCAVTHYKEIQQHHTNRFIEHSIEHLNLERKCAILDNDKKTAREMARQIKQLKQGDLTPAINFNFMLGSNTLCYSHKHQKVILTHGFMK